MGNYFNLWPCVVRSLTTYTMYVYMCSTRTCTCAAHQRSLPLGHIPFATKVKGSVHSQTAHHAHPSGKHQPYQRGKLYSNHEHLGETWPLISNPINIPTR